MNHKRLGTTVSAVMIASALPYLTLKVGWLLRLTPGATGAAGAAELTDVRHLVGDAVTVGMELVAVALVLAMTSRWGRRLPAVLVLVPVWVATGLLAPIALGLPAGLVAQASAGGAPVPAGNGLHDWVYAVVYGGFVVQAVALVAAFVRYARDRWPAVLRSRLCELGAPAARVPWGTSVAAVLALGYAGLLVLWSVAGTAWGAPAGFDTVAQRTFLTAEGVLVLLGAAGVPALVLRRGGAPTWVPLTLAWIGTGVTTLSGPAHVALSHEGAPSPLLAAVSLTATLVGIALAGSTVRAVTGRTPERGDADPPSASRPGNALATAADRG